MGDSVYVLDANVFIEAARHYYPFDLAPPFWQSLLLHANTRVRSIDRVKREVQSGNDELASWMKTQFSHACASTDEPAVTKSFAEIMAWVRNEKQFSEAAKAAFADEADGWLVAYARANGCVVVTHEAHSPDARKKIPIPNICKQFNVPYVDTFAMLRDLGVRFS